MDLSILVYSIYGVLAVGLLWHLVVYTAPLFHKPIPLADRHLPVSVIVCARNEEENLRAHIPLWMQQNYHNYELIIVNDRSGDGTFDFLKSCTEKYPNLKAVHIDQNPQNMDPKKYAITLGIKAAKYEYLLFTDADCTPMNNNWILYMQAAFQQQKALVIGLSEYKQEPGFLNAFIRYETFMTAVHYVGYALRGMPYMGLGRNMAYTKKLFFDNTGFHPHMDVTGGDDDLFVNKVSTSTNTAIQTMLESKTLSIPKKDWSSWSSQKLRHMSVGKYYSGGSKFVLAMHNLLHVLYYLCAITLIFIPESTWIGIGAFLGRPLILWIVYQKIVYKWKYNIKSYWVWMFDPLYVVYIVVFGTRALMLKKVKWN